MLKKRMLTSWPWGEAAAVFRGSEERVSVCLCQYELKTSPMCELCRVVCDQGGSVERQQPEVRRRVSGRCASSSACVGSGWSPRRLVRSPFAQSIWVYFMFFPLNNYCTVPCWGWVGLISSSLSVDILSMCCHSNSRAIATTSINTDNRRPLKFLFNQGRFHRAWLLMAPQSLFL